MPYLTFEVENQRIRRTDNFYVVAKSKEYLYARFTFTDDWGTQTKTAQFKDTCTDTVYEVLIDENGICLVPWEVLEEGDVKVEVTVFAGDRITANCASFRVHETGYSDDAESSQPPTPSIYAQIIERMDGIETEMEEATQRAEDAATAATLATAQAQQSMEDARSSAAAASNSAYIASTLAQSATASANRAELAENGAVSAKEDAESAKADAEAAKDIAESARDAALQAKTDAQEALAEIQTLLAGLTEILIGMQDTSGNDVEVTVLGREG